MQNAPENVERKGAEISSVEPLCAEVPYKKAEEIGGPAGLEPTRFGDWERKGRCIDF
jgi:hypothetical protein